MRHTHAAHIHIAHRPLLLLVLAATSLTLSCSSDDSAESSDDVRRPADANRDVHDSSRLKSDPSSSLLPLDNLLSEGAAKREAESSGQPGAAAGGETPAAPAEQAVRSWRRSSLATHRSRLMIGEDDELPLLRTDAHVVIDGPRARVILDQLYAHAERATREGTLQLRLPEGAQLRGFAFGESTFVAPEVAEAQLYSASDESAPTDPLSMGEAILDPQRAPTARRWSSVKAARLAPRDRAHHAYDETVHVQRVDPALVEWSGAGVFEARVFPLRAFRVQHIVITYDVDLVELGADLEYRFDATDELRLGQIDVRVLPVPGARLAAQGFDADQGTVDDQGRRRFSASRPGERSLRVRQQHAGAVTLIDPIVAEGMRGKWRSPFTGLGGEGRLSSDGATVVPRRGTWAAWVRPELPVVPVQTAPRAVFLVDTSLSSAPDRYPVWLALLRAVLEENRDHIGEFAILFADVQTSWWRPRFVANTPANVEAAVASASSRSLHGATDLAAALGEVAAPGWSDASGDAWDVFLLSDGAATWGRTDVASLTAQLAGPHGRVRAAYGYRTGLAGADLPALDALTRASGGAVFSVTGEADVSGAARAHRVAAYDVHDISVAGAEDVIIAGRPHAIWPGQRLKLVGRQAAEGRAGIAQHARLVLRQPTSEGPPARREVSLALGPQLTSVLAEGAFGEVATAQLEQAAEHPGSGLVVDDARAAAVAFSCHYRIPSRSCSLVMLEGEFDYQRYGIDGDAEAGFALRANRADLDSLLSVLDAPPPSLAASATERFAALVDRLDDDPRVVVADRRLAEAWLREVDKASLGVVPTPLRPAEGTPPALPLVTSAVWAQAETLQGAGQTDDALRLLSNRVERRPGSAEVLRDAAFAAIAWGRAAHAVPLLERSLDLRLTEPQTVLVLADTLAGLGQDRLAAAYYELLLAVTWPRRHQQTMPVVRIAYARLLTGMQHDSASTAEQVAFAKRRLPELLKGDELRVASGDLVVVLLWTTDRSDVDLAVASSGGGEASGRRKLAAFGRHLGDVTTGLGPEVFGAAPRTKGTLDIWATAYAVDRTRTVQATRVLAQIIEFPGTSFEKTTIASTTFTRAAIRSSATLGSDRSLGDEWLQEKKPVASVRFRPGPGMARVAITQGLGGTR